MPLLFILFAILVKILIVFSLRFYYWVKLNSFSKNISILKKSSKKDGLALTSLIASNPLRLTSSESSSSDTLNNSFLESSSSDTLIDSLLESSSSDTLNNSLLESSSSETLNNSFLDSSVSDTLSDASSDTLSVISLETSTSETLSVTSSEGNVLLDIYSNAIWRGFEVREGISITSRESRTILDRDAFLAWRDIVNDLHEYPENTPIGILQQVKVEELSILYRQDLIDFNISAQQLRHIIEHFPAYDLFDPQINPMILFMMSILQT